MDVIKLEWGQFHEDYKASLLSETDIESSLNDYDIVLIKDDRVLKENAVSYYAGYCAFQKVNCNECKTKLVKQNEEISKPSEVFIVERNFNKSTKYGALKAPTPVYFEVAKLIVLIFEQMFRKECHLPNVCFKISDRCIEIVKRDIPGFLPHEDNPCYDHLKTLIHFFIVVLTRKNSKWSVLKGDFQNLKTKNKRGPPTQASKKLKILKN